MTIHEKRKLLIFSFFIFWSYFFLNGYFNKSLSQDPYAFFFSEILVWVLFPLWNLYYLIYKKNILSFYNLGFHNLIFHRRNSDYVIYTSIVFSVLFPIFYVNTYSFFKSFFPINYLYAFSYHTTIPKDFFGEIIVALFFAFTAGFVEEVYYRSILRLVFQDDFSFNIKYILVSSLLFSLNHWEGGVINLFSTFLFGLSAAILYLKIKNIWPLVSAHVVTDIVAFYPGYIPLITLLCFLFLFIWIINDYRSRKYFC